MNINKIKRSTIYGENAVLTAQLSGGIKTQTSKIKLNQFKINVLDVKLKQRRLIYGEDAVATAQWSEWTKINEISQFEEVLVTIHFQTPGRLGLKYLTKVKTNVNCN